MKIRSCSPVPTSSPRIIAFPSYIRLERRLIHSLSIGQGTFLSNPSHRPDHIEVMDDWPGLKSLMLAWQLPSFLSPGHMKRTGKGNARRKPR